MGRLCASPQNEHHAFSRLGSQIFSLKSARNKASSCIAADPQYLDVFIPAGVKKRFKIDTYRRAFAYVFDGAAVFADAAPPQGILLE